MREGRGRLMDEALLKHALAANDGGVRKSAAVKVINLKNELISRTLANADLTLRDFQDTPACELGPTFKKLAIIAMQQLVPATELYGMSDLAKTAALDAVGQRVIASVIRLLPQDKAGAVLLKKIAEPGTESIANNDAEKAKKDLNASGTVVPEETTILSAEEEANILADVINNNSPTGMPDPMNPIIEVASSTPVSSDSMTDRAFAQAMEAIIEAARKVAESAPIAAPKKEDFTSNDVEKAKKGLTAGGNVTPESAVVAPAANTADSLESLVSEIENEINSPSGMGTAPAKKEASTGNETIEELLATLRG